MTRKTVPDEVRRFILTSIPSVPYLEAMLLLRAESSQRWDSFKLASRLYIGEAEARELLRQLSAANVAAAAQDGYVIFSPTPELASKLDALAAAYSQDLVAVSDLIHSRLDKRAHQFATAFRWRKDGD